MRVNEKNIANKDKQRVRIIPNNIVILSFFLIGLVMNDRNRIDMHDVMRSIGVKWKDSPLVS